MHFGVVMNFWGCIIQHYGEKERERVSVCAYAINAVAVVQVPRRYFYFFRICFPKLYASKYSMLSGSCCLLILNFKYAIRKANMQHC